MKIKFQNNTRLTIGVIIFFVLFLDYLILLRPQLVILGQIKRQINALSADLKSTKEGIASIDQLKKQRAFLQSRIGTVGERITPEGEIPVVLENISKIAKQTNLKITQIKPSRESEKMIATSPVGVIYELPILVEGRCGYHQLGSFVNKLEGSKIFMDLAGMEMVPSPDDALHHNIKLVVKTYIVEKK